MICKNCGATFDAQLPRCPYCNAMNEIGAKKQFYHKIKHILKKMNVISELPQRTVLTASGKLLLGITIILSVIIGIILVRTKIINQRYYLETAETEEKFFQRVAWEKEVYPKLDAWYEAGDYDKILRVYHDTYLDPENNNSIYTWRHSEFIYIYDNYFYILQLRKEIEEGEAIGDIFESEALYTTLQFYYNNAPEQLKLRTPKDIEHSDWGLTEQELLLIKQYRQECKDILQNEYSMTQEEMDHLYNKCLENKDVFKVCKDFIRKKETEGGN